ncbi:MAG TPA: hypothetical protein VMO47_00815 [Rhodothermales bacterium]|nr:hypothetical protein [Rhodothermales bacterium]
MEQPPRIVYPTDSAPVVETVARALRNELFEKAHLSSISSESVHETVGLRVAVASNCPWPLPDDLPVHDPWMFARIEEGNGIVAASDPRFLYGLFGVVKERIESGDPNSLEGGLTIRPQFRWITGREDQHMLRLGYLKRRKDPVTLDDVEQSFREAARLGCTHVVVNEPAERTPHEAGPEGEIYYRFYAYAIDIDQYVETKLNKGTYPPELLNGNLTLLKKLSALAVKYGLTPGLYSANPRSVPESLLRKYPFLRGARIDHTYRAFEPRYTLTLAHPAVRWHYAELMRNLLREVPELGFMIALLNDSGSGFEYTASLYPGRNGGPYLVREWRPDAEIARLAAENVIRYYRLIRDAAHEINPEFRIQTGLKNIAEEAEIILDGLDNGIDLHRISQRSDYDDGWFGTMQRFRAKGSEMCGDAILRGSPQIIGVPSPWQAARKLDQLKTAGFRHVEVYIDAPFLVESEINREVLHAFQFSAERTVDEVVREFADRLVGSDLADQLVAVWRASDEAVAATPWHSLYGGQGFTWYRWWVRPFVPNISAIPEADRAYYEKYILSIFNNPHNVDFSKDCLWDLITRSEAEDQLAKFDGEVWEPLDRAISMAAEAALSVADGANVVFEETRDRLRAYRSYCRTLRNISAWIAGVHGYLQAGSDSERTRWRAVVDEMVANELENAKELLELWESTDLDFVVLAEHGETMHTHGTNLPDLLRKKIDLMGQYGGVEPYIDPNYMWRMPAGSDLAEAEYLRC